MIATIQPALQTSQSHLLLRLIATTQPALQTSMPHLPPCLTLLGLLVKILQLR